MQENVQKDEANKKSKAANFGDARSRSRGKTTTAPSPKAKANASSAIRSKSKWEEKTELWQRQIYAAFVWFRYISILNMASLPFKFNLMKDFSSFDFDLPFLSSSG